MLTMLLKPSAKWPEQFPERLIQIIRKAFACLPCSFHLFVEILWSKTIFPNSSSELRSFRLRVVSPTSRVDSPTSNMSVRLRLKLDLYYDNHWFTFLMCVRCRSQSIWSVQQLSELLLLPKSRTNNRHTTNCNIIEPGGKVGTSRNYLGRASHKLVNTKTANFGLFHLKCLLVGVFGMF